MSELTNTHIAFLQSSLKKLLGKAVEGTMAYVRCLPVAVMRELSKSGDFNIEGWDIYFVAGESEMGARTITADRAVDLREEKRGSALLMVDAKGAGAGMDGIYSAVREIREDELLGEASKQALKNVKKPLREFLKETLSVASRLGRSNRISPWHEFDFFARCVASPESVGESVALVGLWPIWINGELRESDLSASAGIVERLFLSHSPGATIQSRVGSLMLPDSAAEQSLELENLLRSANARHWKESVLEARSHQNLWLNRIEPGFQSQMLKSIELVPWRGNRGVLLKWSGLIADDDGAPLSTDKDRAPLLYLDRESPEKTKLEVRWKVLPAGIKAGSVDYKVAIITESGAELAARQVSHADKDTQRCVFTGGDFEELIELNDDGKWEVRVVVHPAGEEPPAEEGASNTWRESEEFILTFGSKEAEVKSSVGKKVRALVEEAIKLSDEDFTAAAASQLVEDSKGYLTYRINGKSGRVYRPSLIKAVEDDWQRNGFQPGRWVVQIRTESSFVSAPEFKAINDDRVDASVWRRVEEFTRQLAQKAAQRGGFVGMIYRELEVATNYVNAWAAALDGGAPELALANTVEIQSLTGRTIGLIVLPSHPLRVAWYQAYDELAYHVRFGERLKPADIVRLLKALDGSYYPAFLPGLESGSAFVFGDMLGFHAVAMIPEGDPEPQATIARLARCLSPSQENTAPSVGLNAAEAIAREITKYHDLHWQYSNLRINALRPGDGLTITQAIGLALNSSQRKKDEVDQDTSRNGVGFTLDLFPSPSQTSSRVLGRFLSEMTERRRAGVGVLSAEDSWMTETVNIAGNAAPRLKWAKRSEPEPSFPAHLSVAFDTFGSEIEILPSEELPPQINQTRPLEAFGLGAPIARHFTFTPVPTWTSTIAFRVDGEKHPAGRGYSERLVKINSAVMQAVAAHKSGETSAGEKWPVLRTRLKSNEADSVRRLHELSDWVVTIDRNVGVEYFDAPRQEPEVYDTYVIDCVPERQDQASVQLVTSTSHLDEVRGLLSRSLSEMGLSQSRRNCDFLLQNLKAVSGRLAMRLSNKGAESSELIAIALFHAHCVKTGQYLSLTDSFIVPVDDIRELVADLSQKKTGIAAEEETSERRADLIGVGLSKRGLLRFKFIEIKNRRTLRSACDPSLHQAICEQTRQTRQRWVNNFFAPGLSQSEQVIRRRRLARALYFYLEKANRHYLEEGHYQKLTAAIDKLFRSEAPLAEEVDDLGVIFCPEHRDSAREAYSDGETRVFLFGPSQIPDTAARSAFAALPAPIENLSHELPSSPPQDDEEQNAAASVIATTDPIHSVAAIVSQPDASSPPAPQEEVNLLLGHSINIDAPVNWKLTIKGNPHLMIVGLPGMGKTTSIINLCEQLYRRGITPIVFAYHDDIEEKLRAKLGELILSDIEHGLGFNPMRVVSQSPHAWLDNVGMLRDIFAAINPDFGDIQNNEIREAIKQSYVELGYEQSLPGLTVPEFQRFVDILRKKAKPNPGVMARLQELNDYGFFRLTGEPISLLDNKKPTIIRLYATQNEALQKAMASFILLNIYQNMFLRGLQPSLTHAVIFDEAHRASRLKLIPTMAKECRKYGLSLILASQEARDFDQSLYSAIANYLVLRVTETDAKALANNVASSGDAKNIAAKLKQLAKFSAMFCTEGKNPAFIKLLSEYAPQD